MSYELVQGCGHVTAGTPRIRRANALRKFEVTPTLTHTPTHNS